MHRFLGSVLRRSRFATARSAAIALAALSWGVPAVGQQLLFHLPLDGTTDVLGSPGANAQLYLFDGGPPPATVPGKIGSALHFSGNASIAIPFSLDAVAHPKVTVTAWVKLDPDSTGDRTVFSAGNGNVPKLMILGNRAQFTAARATLIYTEPMPRDAWVFVAGVVDVAAARLVVHQGDAQMVRDGISTANLYPPSSYRNPDDPSLPRTRYVFVGSHGFNQWRARQMAIDDVRVYAGAMSQEQVAAIRAAATVESVLSQPAPGGGTSSEGGPEFFGRVLTDQQAADLGAAREGQRPIDITYDSEEEALAAAERREREAGQEDLYRQQNELEAQRSATEDDATTAADELPYLPVGDPRFSSLAGQAGEDVQMVDIEDQFIDYIGLVRKRGAATCEVVVRGNAGREKRYGRCVASGQDLESTAGNLSDAVIGSIAVCRKEPMEGLVLPSVEGVRITGHHIKDDGTSIYVAATRTIRFASGCMDWTPVMLCPVNPEHLATGLVVHSKTLDDGAQMIVGLQLVCRRIGTR